MKILKRHRSPRFPLNINVTHLIKLNFNSTELSTSLYVRGVDIDREPVYIMYRRVCRSLNIIKSLKCLNQILTYSLDYCKYHILHVAVQQIQCQRQQHEPPLLRVPRQDLDEDWAGSLSSNSLQRETETRTMMGVDGGDDDDESMAMTRNVAGCLMEL